jgi:hypothetical protein
VSDKGGTDCSAPVCKGAAITASKHDQVLSMIESSAGIYSVYFTRNPFSDYLQCMEMTLWKRRAESSGDAWGVSLTAIIISFILSLPFMIHFGP